MKLTIEQFTKKLSSNEVFSEISEDQLVSWVNKIFSLPQVDYIDDEDAEKFLVHIIKDMPEEIDFHLTRLSGFGGSEIGGICKSLRGEQAFRNSANASVSSKLMAKLPTKSTGPMLRGKLYEPFAKANFEKRLTDMGYKWFELKHEQKNIIENSENKRHPWLRSSLDGLYQVNGEVWIVDFKCPSPDVIKEYDRTGGKFSKPEDCSLDSFIPVRSVRESQNVNHVPFEDYIYQLHHYGLDASIKGVNADKYVLSIFDCLNVESSFIEVEKDYSIERDIVEAGDFYWNEALMQGRIPNNVETRRFEMGDLIHDQRQFMDDVTHQIAKFSLLSKACDDVVTNLKGELKSFIGESLPTLPDGSVVHNLVEMKEKTTLDDDQLESRLRELGLSEEEIDELRATPTYDNKALREIYSKQSIEIRNLLKNIERQDKTGMQNALRELQQLVLNSPPQKKGKFIEKKVQEKLLTFKGEDISHYTDRSFQVGITRKKSPEKDRLCEITQESIEEISYRRDQVMNEDNAFN